jgi:addiction module HigA family antidote
MNKKRKPTHPGAILKYHYLEPLKLTVTEVAHSLGLARKTISQIINGRGSITPDIALRLSQAFETSAELWLNLQKTYDLWKVAKESKDWKKIRPFDLKTLNPV